MANINLGRCKANKTILVFGLLLDLSLASFGQQTGGKPENTKAGQKVLKLNEEFDKAIAAQNAAEYERILADDFIFTNSSGKVTNKSEELAQVRSGDFKYESVKSEDVRVKVYGKTAVVTGRFIARVQHKGNDFAISERYTAVFVKRGSGWQMAVEHASEIAQK